MHSYTGARLGIVFVGTALFAACSSSSPQLVQTLPAGDSEASSAFHGPSVFSARATHGPLRIWGTTKGATLFVSTPATAAVNIYNRKGKLQGQITGFSVPGGLAVDGSGNLYVTDEGDLVIDVFAPGGSTPEKVLTDGTDSPAYVAVAGDGTVYASNITNGSPGSISVWSSGSTSPTSHITDSNVFNFHGVGVDGNGDLFAAWSSNKGTAGVDEVPAGSSTPADLGLHGVLVPIGVAIDKHGSLVVADAGDATVKIFRHGATFTSRTIGGFSQPSLLAFDQRGKTLFVSDAQGSDVAILRYKSGKLKSEVTAGLSASNYAWGVALNPAASP